MAIYAIGDVQGCFTPCSHCSTVCILIAHETGSGLLVIW